MEKENIVVGKSYAFALRIVKLYKHLVGNNREWVLSKQVLRSGTSVGANVEEAIGAQSKKDFISKINIAYKESRETNYWLRLLKDSDYLEELHYKSISDDCKELQRILAAIVLNSQKRQN
jgi:four helix bundle protein